MITYLFLGIQASLTISEQFSTMIANFNVINEKAGGSFSFKVQLFSEKLNFILRLTQ